MWLPKDERKLLAYYFNELDRPKDFKTYKDPVELMKVLGYKPTHAEQAQDSPFIWRVWDANDKLNERRLAKINRDTIGMDVTVSLTSEGWDLGEKYNNWFDKSGLWWEEYKGHWIWPVVGFFIGLVTGKLL